MDLVGVLNGFEMSDLPSFDAQFLDRSGPIGEQSGLPGGIGPGVCDDSSAKFRTHLVAVDLDPCVDGTSVHQALFDQQAFERLHPQRRLARHMGADVVVVLGGLVGILRPHSIVPFANGTDSRQSPAVGFLPDPRLVRFDHHLTFCPIAAAA